MSSLHSAYTPLESLLLFQAVRSEGAHVSFNGISEQLNNIPLIRGDPTYDSRRLNPDALHELYLNLLKDEVKLDHEKQSNGDNKNAIFNSTSDDATRHNHLIPQLVARLYLRYRENVVRGLREHEHRYGILERDLAEIEAGKWDERLQRVRATSARQSPKPSNNDTQPVVTPSVVAFPDLADRVIPTFAQPQDNASPGQAKPSSQTTIDDGINHSLDRPSIPKLRELTPSSTTLPSVSETAPRSPHPGTPKNIHELVQADQQQPPAKPTITSHTQPQPVGQQVHHQQQQINSPVHAIDASKPQAQQSTPQRFPSPNPVLPPPPGLKVQPHSSQPVFPLGNQSKPPPPQQQLPIHNPMHPAQFQAHDFQNRTNNEQHVRPVPAGGNHQQQQQHQHQPSQPQTPFPDNRAPHSSQLPQTPTYPSQPPHINAPNFLPPHAAFQNPAKVPNPVPPQSRQPPFMPHQWSTPQVSHTQTAPATEPKNVTYPSSLISDIVRALATPLRSRTRPLWKSEHRPPPIHVSTEPSRPEIEPMSPTRERMRSPARSTRSNRSRDHRTAEEVSQDLPIKARPTRRRQNARAGSPHSVISSTMDESYRARTRSQSVSTVAGTTAASDERPGSRGGVKAEPSTPADVLEDPESTPAPVTTPASGPRTRKRRGTLPAQAPPPSKRKMPGSPEALENDRENTASSPRRSKTVIAAKNFSKMSAAVMNDINSHKHASYFANTVREKDAPGYSEIVFQPQSLKSIRAAITAGTRAINSASSNVDSPTGTPAASTSRSFESSTTIELERTVDLIPPKAIVNGAQLEKELMRMFANAFMFNPGEDGMALITKEMFQDVEQTLNDWRGTEREVGIDEEDDGKGKRRKL